MWIRAAINTSVLTSHKPETGTHLYTGIERGWCGSNLWPLNCELNTQPLSHSSTSEVLRGRSLDCEHIPTFWKTLFILLKAAAQHEQAVTGTLSTSTGMNKLKIVHNSICSLICVVIQSVVVWFKCHKSVAHPHSLSPQVNALNFYLPVCLGEYLGNWTEMYEEFKSGPLLNWQPVWWKTLPEHQQVRYYKKN